jgi:NAD(P)-dependent dehydrogenase (short-subunit alcohol dehydrogenase family)
MPQTVLITGTSSGIGEATAHHFADKGWNVVATMRKPEERKTSLHDRKDLLLLHLDVLDQASIEQAIAQTLEKFERIDVLVNNAGYAVMGPFEATPPANIRRQFDTNVFGLMDVCRAILPIFRKQKDGTIVNVASVAGRITVPLYSLYNSTKWAVEGFSEALHYELEPLGIRVKIFEPGIIKTDFYTRSLDVAKDEALTDYDDFVKRVEAKNAEAAERGSTPQVIAAAIHKAACDRSFKLRYAAGELAKLTLFARKILPDALFFRMIRSTTVG